jgi:hypothetical protein
MKDEGDGGASFALLDDSARNKKKREKQEKLTNDCDCLVC